MPLEVSPTCSSHGYEFGAVGGNALGMMPLGKEAGDEKVDEEVKEMKLSSSTK